MAIWITGSVETATRAIAPRCAQPLCLKARRVVKTEATIITTNTAIAEAAWRIGRDLSPLNVTRYLLIP